MRIALAAAAEQGVAAGVGTAASFSASAVAAAFAASLQETLEVIIFHILKYYRFKTNQTKLCLAGGVGHNCSANGKILYSGLFEDVRLVQHYMNM